MAEDGLRGVTSNPSIFEKAIGHGDDYDALIAAAERSGDLDPGALFEELAIRDIQDGADALSAVYEQTQRRDGYISIEVSPYLAMQTHETIEEARRLWRNVGRRNLMVKVPATKPGLPAIRALIGEGINVNITLLFSQKVYEEVAEAYIAGLEDFVAKGGDPHKVASVASFFVSRIDTLVDEALDKRIAATSDPAEKQKSRRRSRARSRSPTPSSPISSISASSATSAGSGWRRRGRRRSACYGPAPAPRTRPTAMCCMSRS